MRQYVGLAIEISFGYHSGTAQSFFENLFQILPENDLVIPSSGCSRHCLSNRASRPYEDHSQVRSMTEPKLPAPRRLDCQRACKSVGPTQGAARSTTRCALMVDAVSRQYSRLISPA